jgi:2-oxoglutarate ferredoxin oxidoreductase subunit delta
MKDFKAKQSQGKGKKVIVFHGLCKGCGLCLVKCPFGAISFSTKDIGIYSTPTVEIDLEKCTACGICEVTCPDSALKIEKGK